MEDHPMRGLRRPDQHVSEGHDTGAVRRTRHLIRTRHLPGYGADTNVRAFPPDALPRGEYPAITAADLIWLDHVDRYDPSQPWPPKDGDL